jgi:hypothetical protein
MTIPSLPTHKFAQYVYSRSQGDKYYVDYQHRSEQRIVWRFKKGDEVVSAILFETQSRARQTLVAINYRSQEGITRTESNKYTPIFKFPRIELLQFNLPAQLRGVAWKFGTAST